MVSALHCVSVSCSLCFIASFCETTKNTFSIFAKEYKQELLEDNTWQTLILNQTCFLVSSISFSCFPIVSSRSFTYNRQFLSFPNYSNRLKTFLKNKYSHMNKLPCLLIVYKDLSNDLVPFSTLLSCLHAPSTIQQ